MESAPTLGLEAWQTLVAGLAPAAAADTSTIRLIPCGCTDIGRQWSMGFRVQIGATRRQRRIVLFQRGSGLGVQLPRRLNNASQDQRTANHAG